MPVARSQIAAVVGPATAGVRFGVSRRTMALAAILGLTLLGGAVYFGFANPVPTLVTGSCMSGVRAGAAITANSVRLVDCAVAHENEVVGTFDYAGSADFPGQPALLAYAEAPCLRAFADYVGIDFHASSLDMIAVTPSDQSWGTGDRQISCVAVDPKGATLTGSIRSSGR